MSKLSFDKNVIKNNFYKLIQKNKSLDTFNLNLNIKKTLKEKKRVSNLYIYIKKKISNKIKSIPKIFQYKRYLVSMKYRNLFLSKMQRSFVKHRLLRKKNLEVQPFINELKVSYKFKSILSDSLDYTRVCLKYTGSNIFLTLTNNQGEVLFSYSAGLFRNLRTRKEKTTVLVAQYLGQVCSLRLNKSSARYIFVVPFVEYRGSKKFFLSLVYGLGYLRSVILTGFIIKRTVVRNGIRKRKLARK